MCVVSVIIPVHNGEKWIDPCMTSIANQTIINNNNNGQTSLEIVIYNDGSEDDTEKILVKWSNLFQRNGVSFIVIGSSTCQGCGAAKNRAVEKSTGQFLCFQDIDDIMHPERIRLQLQAARERPHALIGSQISRMPLNSTPRLVNWANNLTSTQLKHQIYTSHGPTLLMPTWFCHKSVYEKVGGFDETGKGTPEDLIFFYSHLNADGDLYRVDEKLLIYTYHEGATTFSVTRERIWQIQLDRLEKYVFPQWNNFTIWNAGKAGRKLIRSMNPNTAKKVIAFCDVDKNKIGHTIELYCPVEKKVKHKLPVVHFTEAKPPLVICMKLDLTNGQFEQNLKSMNLTEGSDYIIFN